MVSLRGGRRQRWRHMALLLPANAGERDGKGENGESRIGAWRGMAVAARRSAAGGRAHSAVKQQWTCMEWGDLNFF